MPSKAKPAAAKSASAKSGSALDGLLSILDLEPLEENLFRGRSPQEGWQRVFGGQVLGQALVAAVRTVQEERIAHSLHAYFLLGGDPASPIIYNVDRMRDGGSFTTRRVKAIQHGRPMFVMSVSFHTEEPGSTIRTPCRRCRRPRSCRASASSRPSSWRACRRTCAATGSASARSRCARSMSPATSPARTAQPEQAIWMRASGRLPDAFALHQCVLAYASDFTLLDTALIAHGKLMFDKDMQLASLDHALWFHRPFRADEWLLYVQDSPSSHGARGFCRGNIFTRDGVFVASVAQEGLMRQRTSAFVPS